MTKICVTSQGNDLAAPIDPRFGRCAFFIIADSETMQFEAISNSAMRASGGAGIQAAQTVASMGVKAVITGSVGPNAYPALQNAGIEIMTGVSGTVKDAIESFKQGSLTKLATPGPTQKGYGGGMGGGMGRGGGRGRGGGGRGGGGGGRGRW